MHKVLSTGNAFSDEQIASLRNHQIEIIKGKTNFSEDEIIHTLEDMEGYIIGGDEIATRNVIDSSKRLKIISFPGAGYERYIDVKAATEKGIVVTYTPGANARAVAEQTVALLLDISKNITYLNNSTKRGGYEKREVPTLEGKTIGIIGMGHIGQIVAKILHSGFGMNIVYTSNSSKLDIEISLKAKKIALEELLASSDFVSIHTPLNDQTKRMIGEKEFALMKPTAVLVNTSRADIVDGHALYEALQAGTLDCAAFDVYYQEPVPTPKDDPYKLMSLPNDKFLLTPHNAYNTQQAVEKMNEMLIETLVDFFSGKPLKYQVTSPSEETRK